MMIMHAHNEDNINVNVRRKKEEEGNGMDSGRRQHWKVSWSMTLKYRHCKMLLLVKIN